MSEKKATVEQLVSLMVEQVRYMTGGLLREHETNAQMLRQLARVWEDTASGYLAHSYAEDATWAAAAAREAAEDAADAAREAARKLVAAP